MFPFKKIRFPNLVVPIIIVIFIIVIKVEVAIVAGPSGITGSCIIAVMFSMRRIGTNFDLFREVGTFVGFGKRKLKDLVVCVLVKFGTVRSTVCAFLQAEHAAMKSLM